MAPKGSSRGHNAKYPDLTPRAIDEARALIGVPLRRRSPYTAATSETLLRYAKALGCRNPLYSDLAHGLLKTPWAAHVGHPTCIFTFDNTFVAPRLPGIHAIYGGVKIEWFRQIRAGERITATAALTGVQEKRGAFCGPMALQESEVRYVDAAGTLVARARPRILRTPRDRARATGKYAGIERHAYTEEEFIAILNAYRDEHVQGHKPLYVEDVAVGSHLPTVVKGPLTTEDMNLFVGEVHVPYFFKAFVEHMRRHPADVYWHPELNMPDTWDASWLQDAPAQEFGFPLAHDTGIQRVAWLECMITNWMGDLGMLTMLDVHLERPMFHADTAWLRGEVAEVSLEGARPVVRLSLLCENQRGEATARGTARVELPSRDFAFVQPGLRVPAWAASD